MNYFQNAIEVVFNKWDALQFSISNQTGGAESKAIAQWMVGVTEQYFQENDNLEPDEVADFLKTILDTELNTLVEDGSDLEVSKLLCEVFRLQEQGKISDIETILSQYDNSHQLVTINAAPSEDESMQCEDFNESVASQISSLSISEQGLTNVPLLNQSHPPSCSLPNIAEDSATHSTEQDDDGWTVVKKGKRKPI